MKARRNILTLLSAYVTVGVMAMALVVGARPARASFFDVFFDISMDTASGPPYPTVDPLVVKVFDKASPLLADLPIEEVTLTFADGIEDVPMQILGSDTGGGLGLAGTTATFEVFLTGGEAPPPILTVECFLNVYSPSGVSAILSDPVLYSATEFDLCFEVQMVDGGIMRNYLHGASGSQPLTYGSIQWEYMPTEAYDMFLTIEMEPFGLIDAASPILALQLTGSYIPEPATLAVLAVGACLPLLRRSRIRRGGRN